MIRSVGSAIVLSLAIAGTACSSLVKFSVSSIPRLVTPITKSSFDELLGQLTPFVELSSLRAWSVLIRFDDLESAERYREADAALVLKRPDSIRLIISIPMVKSKIAEMVSENNHFRVAIYPTDYQRFLMGTNSADYTVWRERLGEKGRSALVSARPFHFTDALLIRPLQLQNPRLTYSLEESLVETPDPNPKAGKGARALRSFYVISEIELASAGQSGSRVRRKFWFDRTEQSVFSRQQIFDEQGNLQTDVAYSNYRKLSESDRNLWPGMIQVSRPYDNYQARLTFNEERFETNVELPPNAFVLENAEGLPETDLDKPTVSLIPNSAGMPRSAASVRAGR